MWRVNNGNPVIARRASVNWMMLIYFASGACALIDEVVWVRLLKLTLGNTVYASSIVVSVFMGGLALGALIMGRYCDQIKRHLRLYAMLEAFVTISALSLPWALKLADNVYVWFYRTYQPSHAQLLIVQVVISAGLMLVPSMLMGSTLPLVGRFVTALEKEAGHLVGRLYALNTLGAALGCFLAGFVLIRALGVMGALYTAAVLNLMVAFGGWFLSRFSGVADGDYLQPVPADAPEVVAAKTTDGRFYLLVAAFFMSGLISIGYELLWMRSIVHLLGGVTYVFSAVLTVYLLGNVIGAGIGSRLARRLQNPAAGFAVTLSLLGVCGVLYLPVLIVWTSKVLPHINPILVAIYLRLSVCYFVVGSIVQSLFLFLVPTVVMGIGFPIALQGWANHMHKVGRSTGTAYGANTIGAVIGGLITGFVLIPLLGVQISMSVLGLAGVWIAGFMWLLFARNLRMLKRSLLLIAAVLLTVITIITPLDLFNIVIRINPIHVVDNLELVSVKEGLTTTVSLHKDPKDGSLQLYSSGQSIAGDHYIERGDQKMLGHFGVFLNSSAKKVLSVGFGSGETTACLALHKLDRLDCVEIAPEIVEVALRYFRHINLADKLGQEVNMIFMDAKNYIHLTDRKYDVIINDSIHPRDFAENSSLYTREYFESAKEHLDKNGMIVSWLPLYDMPASVFDSIIGTLMEVFPHVTVWHLTTQPAPLVLVAASEQQQYFSPKYIEKEMAKKGVPPGLSAIDIYNNMDVMSCYVGDENDLKRCIKTFFVNSDYSPFVEFTTDDRTLHSQMFQRFVMDVRSDSVYNHIDWTGFSEEEKQKWLADYKQLCKASNYLLMSYDVVALDKLKYSMEGLSILPDNPAILDARSRAEANLLSQGAPMIISGRVDEALALARKMLKIYPQSATAWMIRSGAMQSKGEAQKALIYAQRAVELAPDNADARLNLAYMLLKAGQFEQAIAEYEKTLQLYEQKGKLTEQNKVRILDSLSGAYASVGRLAEAIATAEKAFELALSTGQKEVAERISRRLQALKAEFIPQQQR